MAFSRPWPGVTSPIPIEKPRLAKGGVGGIGVRGAESEREGEIEKQFIHFVSKHHEIYLCFNV